MQNTVQIQTAQNVTIHFVPAHLGERMLALLIDNAIIGGTTLLLNYIQNSLLFPSSQNTAPIDADTRYYINLLIFLVNLFPLFFYHLLSEIFMNGQSVGKKIVKIKVACLDGTSPKIAHYLMRWMMRSLDSLLGVATIIINGKGQRLGDIAAGTFVAKIPPEIRLEEVLMIREDNDENYQPLFKQAAKLSDKDINLIKENLRVYKKHQNKVILIHLANKVKQVLQIESQQDPIYFLRAIVRDYTHLKVIEEQAY
jgi:uncharacterized RDD family membrane protein YckC